MTFQWAVVLGAISVVCLFIVWIMRRNKASDKSHGVSDAHTAALAHHPGIEGAFEESQGPTQVRVGTVAAPETQDRPTVAENRPTAQQPTGEVGPFPSPSVDVPRAPADPDQTRAWSAEQGQRLLAGYRKGDSIAVLSRTCGVTGRAVVYELSRQLLEPIGRMVDPTAPKFQTAWSTGELRILDYYYSSDVSLPDIARNMQRDQFEVAFQLFANHIARVPMGPVPPPDMSGLSEKHAVGLSVPSLSESPVPETLQTGGIPKSLEPSEPGPALAIVIPQHVVDDTPSASAVVGRADPSNDSDDNRSWSSNELTRLLHLYADNEDMEIADLARHFGTTSRSVVIALTNLILKPLGPLEDENAPKWRRAWTHRDIDDVHDLFWTGASLQTIAHAVGRDQLSVAFRLLRDRLPEVHCLSEGI
ncbi:hypothetical protein [Arthrobacter sp. C9C5]|uniref:hypothetical protein n=1 Tax=Arthrobacter sp. C9C5 TaxID=2735267 RepID=UPI00158470FF|nr:hypothetical protein [Arthrobacter sp. C9C5]NUU32662.1 hypothetical protein [Arthrobacter sp. C9C5]